MGEHGARGDLDQTVAVVGGGIAGITAAVKLFQQGYKVCLFEKAAVLGGNLSSNSIDNLGTYRDIYPHIFGDWYKEFWYLLENDLGFERDAIFARRDKIRMAMIPENTDKIRRFSDVNFATLATPTSLSNFVDNLDSGILSWRDMFLFGYTYLDLVSVPNETGSLRVLNELDVTGYLAARPFIDNEIADFHDAILKVIWSMPGDQTSAKAYRNLIRHTLTFPNETPFAWLVKGPLGKTLMDPLTNELEKRFKASGGDSAILLNTEVTAIALDKADDQVTLTYSTAGAAPSERSFRYAVIATPAKATLPIAFEPRNGINLMSREPILARFREAEAGRIPVVYLYFKKAFIERHRSDLHALPVELIGFKKAASNQDAAADPAPSGATGNEYDISILNLTGLWPASELDHVSPGEPVLVLAASHAAAIQVLGPDDEAGNNGEAQGFAMIQKLNEYFPFIDPGRRWGAGGDVDWARTRVITNSTHLLFLNDTGSDEWRPSASMPGVKNVFFAGDYCLSDVDMATVEAAVQSGVLAAQALQASDGHGHPIRLQAHDLYAVNALLLAKLVSAPSAFAVALAATYEEARQDPMSALALPFSSLVLATAFWADWLRSAVQFWQASAPGGERSVSGAPAVGDVADHDNRMGVIALGANLALALVTEGPAIAPRLAESAAQGLYAAWRRTVGRSLFPGIRKTLGEPSSPKPSRALGSGPVTPKTLSEAAFGVAATGVKLLETLAGSAAARRRTAAGLRPYKVERRV